MDVHGPEPTTDREYLIRIYASIQQVIPRLEKVEQKTETLERQRWVMAGGIGVGSVFGGWLVQSLVSLLQALGPKGHP